MKKVKLKPAEADKKIPNPKNGFMLREEGEFVYMNKYWRRRLMFGEVVEVKESKKVSKPKKLKDKGDE